MNNTLSDNDLTQILDFVGYGRLDADIWFLGFEENCNTTIDLQHRLKFDQTMDSQDAVNLSGLSVSQLGEYNFQNAWRGMAEVMLKLDGKPASNENIEEYLGSMLGRSEGAALVCSLFPLPMPEDNTWNYEPQVPQYSSREAYYATAKPVRFELFKQLIRQNLPKIIICYGQTAWPEYQQLFTDYNLAPNGSFVVGWDSNTVIILSDHFASNSMAGKFDEVVALIKENSLSIETAKPTGPIPLSKAELARQKKEAAKQASAAKRKPSVKHNPADPFCVCAYCLGYESKK